MFHYTSCITPKRVTRTDPLVAKDRNGRGQGPRTQIFSFMLGKFSIIVERESAQDYAFR